MCFLAIHIWKMTATSDRWLLRLWQLYFRRHRRIDEPFSKFMGGSHVSAHRWLDGSAKTMDQGLHVHLDFGEHHSQQPGHWRTIFQHVCHGPEALWEHTTRLIAPVSIGWPQVCFPGLTEGLELHWTLHWTLENHRNFKSTMKVVHSFPTTVYRTVSCNSSRR